MAFTSSQYAMSNVAAARSPGLLTVLAWPFRHIRWKIILPYAFLTAILAAAGAYIATDLVTGSLEERFTNQLVEAGRVTSDAVVAKEREHLESVRAISLTNGVSEAITNSDSEGLANITRPIAANTGVQRVEVLNAGGQRLFAERLANQDSLSYTPIDDADDPSTWPLVQRALAGGDNLGDKYAQIVETAEGYVLYTAGPVYDGDNVIGVVLVGTNLNSFVLDVKANALADITVYDFDGNPLASSFTLATSGAISEDANLQPSTEVLGETQQGGTVREQHDLFGRGYDLIYGRMRVRDQVVGLYSVALPSDFIFDTAATTRLQVMVLFGLGMAAVLAIGFYITHRLTSPILRLVSTARQVSLGDLTARSGVATGDEIGVLATTFDDMTDKLQRQHLSTIRALTSAIDARDPFTSGHSVRVGQLAMMLGREFNLSDAVLAKLEIGGYLHDIGKIGIRDNVLLKEGKLTEEERHVIEDHPTIGLSILEPVDLPDEVLEFVQGHHEKLDGSGYPRGLRGDEISIFSRIGAVADMYDALTSDRPYRSPMPAHECVEFLRSQAPQYLDLDVVLALGRIVDQWEARRQREPALRGFKLPELHVPVTTQG